MHQSYLSFSLLFAFAIVLAICFDLIVSHFHYIFHYHEQPCQSRENPLKSTSKSEIVACLLLLNSFETNTEVGEHLSCNFCIFLHFFTTYSKLIYQQFSMIAPKPVILLLVTEYMGKAGISFLLLDGHFSILDTIFHHFLFRHSIKH